MHFYHGQCGPGGSGQRLLKKIFEKYTGIFSCPSWNIENYTGNFLGAPDAHVKIEVFENPDGTSNIYVVDDEGNWERMSGPRADNITFKRL